MADRILVAALLGLGLVAHAEAAGLKIGVVAPEGDASFAVLGEQLREGVRTYDASAGHPFQAIADQPETCDAASGTAAAKAMVTAKIDAVIGFFCPESLTAALPALSKAGIVTIGTSVRADIVMEDAIKHGWPFYRLAPHAGAEVDKIVQVISKQWAGQPFAIVEDGTIYGRELAENVRVALEALGVTPAFIDTYRPAQDKQFGLAHRLERSGVTHVFVGGDRSDVAIIARDSAAIGLNLTFMGGDAMKAPDGDVPLRDGVLAVITPEPQTLPSAAAAVAALEKAGHEPYGERIPGYAAAELLAEGGRQTVSGKTNLATAIAKGTFETALGTIRFDQNHERTQNPFELMVWRGDGFAPVGGIPAVQ
ncbi:MAG: ABC transporter substrate-binding protein [Pararhizobium sp.]